MLLTLLWTYRSGMGLREQGLDGPLRDWELGWGRLRGNFQNQVTRGRSVMS